MEELVAFEEAFRQAPDLSRDDAAPGQAPRLLRPAARPSWPAAPRPRSAQARLAHGIRATYKMVDTCAAEFVAHTPYLYSTYEDEDEAPPTERPKVVILGSGPNRIGQGIEFDYACVHAAFALREAGVEAIMVNCNPETVSTDYDTSDRLYFEPLTLEDVLNIVEKEQPLGVIVQFGGQTPLKLAVPLERAGVRILGTSPDAIDRAEDRERFAELLRKLGLQQPPNGSARSADEAGADRGPRSATRCWCARPTSSAAGRWRSSTRRRGSATGCGSRRTSRPITRSSSTSSSRTRSRSTSTRSRTATTS